MHDGAFAFLAAGRAGQHRTDYAQRDANAILDGNNPVDNSALTHLAQRLVAHKARSGRTKPDIGLQFRSRAGC